MARLSRTGRFCILCGASILGAHILGANAQTPQAVDAVVEAVRQRVDDLSASGNLTIEGEHLVAARSLPTLYELHGYQPFWDSRRIASLISLVRGSADDGLTPADYHLAALEKLAASNGTPLQSAQLDLIATDAYVVLLSNLTSGKWTRSRLIIVGTSALARSSSAMRPNLFWTLCPAPISPPQSAWCARITGCTGISSTRSLPIAR